MSSQQSQALSWQSHPLHPLFPKPAATRATAEKLRSCLGRVPATLKIQDLQIEPGQVHDGLHIQALSWWVGYGPRTEAWLLHPAGEEGPWPGVMALHDHGGFRRLGKEKIANGPEGPHPAVQSGGCRAGYEEIAWANELARRGYAVLVHDVLSWGSRRFEAEDLAEQEGQWTPGDPGSDVDSYNAAANQREHSLAKVCNLLGTSFPGLLFYEDQLALQVMLDLPEVASGPLSCLGHSGGGARAMLLAALDPRIGQVGVMNMMCSYSALVEEKAWLHSWQMIPPGWAPAHDWPEILALRTDLELCVLSSDADSGFSAEAQQTARDCLSSAWAEAGVIEGLTILLHEQGHHFGRSEQEALFAWLDRVCSY